MRRYVVFSSLIVILAIAGCSKAPHAAGTTARLPAAGPVASAPAVELPARALRDSEARDAPRGEGMTSEVAAPEPVGKPTTEAAPADAPAGAVKRPQTGVLTAGSLDDQRDFAAFTDYLSRAYQSDAGRHLPQWTLGRRVVIRVCNADGRPLANAQVVVQAANLPAEPGAPPAAAEFITGSDGRVALITGLDAPGAQRTLDVAVFPPDGSAPVRSSLSVDQPECTITIPQADAPTPGQLDLALVIDATGSMSDELEYLKSEIAGIVAEVKHQFPEVDQRFALVVYRDEGDEYVTRRFDFTGSLDEIQQRLAQQHAAGGGDYPEAVDQALEQTAELSWRRQDTARVVFLVADAPPHEHCAARTLEAVGRLRRAGVRVFPVAGSGAAAQAEFVFRTTAFLTQGQYLFLTDHSGVGRAHATPDAPYYEVERLDRLMVRLIAAELTGRSNQAEGVIDTGGNGSQAGATVPHGGGQQSSKTQPVSLSSGSSRRASFVPASGFWMQRLAAVFGLFALIALVDRPWRRSREG